MLHMLSASISKVFNDFTQSLGNDFMILHNIATRSWSKVFDSDMMFHLGNYSDSSTFWSLICSCSITHKKLCLSKSQPEIKIHSPHFPPAQTFVQKTLCHSEPLVRDVELRILNRKTKSAKHQSNWQVNQDPILALLVSIFQIGRRIFLPQTFH